MRTALASLALAALALTACGAPTETYTSTTTDSDTTVSAPATTEPEEVTDPFTALPESLHDAVLRAVDSGDCDDLQAAFDVLDARGAAPEMSALDAVMRSAGCY